MTARQSYLDAHSHPSVAHSMDDFEPRSDDFSPTFPDVPSHHSGFRSPHMSEYSEASRRSYSPPAWRRNGSGWFKQPSLSPEKSGYAGSRECSPQYRSVGGEGFAARIPLPMSPSQGRSPRCSPERDVGAGAGEEELGGGDTTVLNAPRDVQAEAPSVLPVDEGNCESTHPAHTDVLILMMYRHPLDLLPSSPTTHRRHRANRPLHPQSHPPHHPLQVPPPPLLNRLPLNILAPRQPPHHPPFRPRPRPHQSRRPRQVLRARHLLLRSRARTNRRAPGHRRRSLGLRRECAEYEYDFRAHHRRAARRAE